MIIYPAIDIIDGQCVRLTQGLYDTKKVYSESAIDMARKFEDSGFTHLHVVDLDGAKSGKVINYPVLEGIVKSTSLAVDFGGGIRSKQEVMNVLNAGAKQINVGSLAIKQPELVKQWISDFGSEAVILSADVKGRSIAIHGWQEKSLMHLNELIEDFLKAGIRYITCTDISKDGELTGASIDLYKELLSRFPSLNIIASGGVNNLNNLTELVELGCHGAIVGKAIYEKKIELHELVELNTV